MRPIVGFLCFMCFSTVFIVAQEADSLLSSGIEELREGQYKAASRTFGAVLADQSSPAHHPDALYWLIKTNIVLERYQEASGSADLFLLSYPEHPRYSEIAYHRGRLHFLEGDEEEAIEALEQFIADYPGDPFIPSAHYWIGESLMSLGRLEEADKLFAELLEVYPASVKREAAQYRRREIVLLNRQQELLGLLEKSREDHLASTEDFNRREREYHDIIDSYNPSPAGEVPDNQPPVGEIPEDLAHASRLLEIKKRFLDQQEYYIDQLWRLLDVR